MIHSIKFKQDYRCFKTDYEITFRPGINLLVGDQGCGKSSILQLMISLGKKSLLSFKVDEIIKLSCDKSSFLALDFEKDIPRNLGAFGQNFEAQLAMMFWSHGESTKATLKALPVVKEGIVILLDEPDMALSVRSCVEMVKFFSEIEKKSCQIIAAVHNPIFILSQKEVLSLEHHCWMDSKEFLTSHGFSTVG